jgi:hypothetical protein
LCDRFFRDEIYLRLSGKSLRQPLVIAFALWYKLNIALHQRITRTAMKPDAAPASDKTSIQVIERMMSLLDALAGYPDPVSLKELALATGLHPSTAHRILNDMVAKRFVDRTEPGAYRLGMRLLELGNIVKSRLNVREAALPYMQSLHRKTQQTVNLSVRQGDEIIYIETIETSRTRAPPLRSRAYQTVERIVETNRMFIKGPPANREERRRRIFFIGVAPKPDSAIMGECTSCKRNYWRKCVGRRFSYYRQGMCTS